MENSFFAEFEPGMVVISKAGRDKGKPLLVIGCDSETVLVADGKERPLERPKKKNPKHLIKTKKTLAYDNSITNRALRRALREMFGKTPEIDNGDQNI